MKVKDLKETLEKLDENFEIRFWFGDEEIKSIVIQNSQVINW